MSNPPNNIIGIDLGTTETVVARFNEEGKPELLPNRAGQLSTPSVVQILDNGDVIIGEEAKKFVGSDTPNVFAEFNREIGSDKKWVVNGRTLTPTDLSALVLKQVIEECAEPFGKPTSVVISWPATFREEQRQAMMEAASKAGLEVRHYISKERATALYYATVSRLYGHYLIYDFGGSTFDVSIIKIDNDGKEVIWTEGVQQLGGKDLDAELLKIIGNKFTAKSGGTFNAIDCNFGKSQVAEAKHALCVREKTSIRLVSGTYGPVSFEISRQEFEAAISHLVTQAEIACETALMNSKVSKEDIREVFMTGGTSRVPAMQRSVEKLFGRKPVVNEPDNATALGAAIYAAIKAHPSTRLTKTQDMAFKGNEVTDIAPHYVGNIITDSYGNRSVDILIHKGAKVPCSGERIYQASEGQKFITFTICQSAIEERDPEFVSILHEAIFQIPRDHSGRRYKLTVSYDANSSISWRIEPTDDDGDSCVTANRPTGQPLPLRLPSASAGRARKPVGLRAAVQAPAASRRASTSLRGLQGAQGPSWGARRQLKGL